MIEAQLPNSFVDFADALRILSQCSLDATEVVTKWSELMNTTTPAIVSVTVNGVTFKVDNLAKIRRDIAAGLNVDVPRVRGVKLVDGKARGHLGPVESYGSVWKVAGDISYQDEPGYVGVYHGVFNDFYTACMPSKVDVTMKFLDLPKVVLMGAARAVGVLPPDMLNLTVTAPPRSLVQSEELVNTSYYTKVTFVNRNLGMALPDGTAEHAEGLPVRLKVFDSTGALVYERALSPHGSVNLLMFTSPGSGTVNVQEVV